MNRTGIAPESDATRMGIRSDASRGCAPAPVNPTRPDPSKDFSKEKAVSPTHSPHQQNDLLTRSEVVQPARETLDVMFAYRDLLDASIADEEYARDCDEQVRRLRKAAADARQRVANRKAELERRRLQVEAARREARAAA